MGTLKAAAQPEKLVESRLTVDQGRIQKYAEITNDFNPLHIDPVFASTTTMKGVIAHGTMSLALLWQSIQRTFGPAAASCTLDVKFIRPVRIGDELTSGGARRSGSSESYDAWVMNQAGEVVTAGTLHMAMPTHSHEQLERDP
jgi:3-hydroxybutyryl-CoA dehydratase